MTCEVDVREASTGIVPTSPAQRRQLRLRGLWANYTEAQDKLAALLHEAQDNDDFKALGYPSWTAYIADTFGAEPAVRLAREKRQELVCLLSDEGMGTRAIGQALHISKNTVTADLRRQQVSQSGTPEQDAPQLVPATPKKKSTNGLDGKKYARRLREKEMVQRPKPSKETAEEKQALSEANTIAAVATLMRESFTPEHIAELSPEARRHFIHLFEDIIGHLEQVHEKPEKKEPYRGPDLGPVGKDHEGAPTMRSMGVNVSPLAAVENVANAMVGYSLALDIVLKTGLRDVSPEDADRLLASLNTSMKVIDQVASMLEAATGGM